MIRAQQQRKVQHHQGWSLRTEPGS